MTPIYYESHVTLEPVFDEKLEALQGHARKHGFRVADLIMQKKRKETPVRSKQDSFCTGRGPDFAELEGRMRGLASDLTAAGYEVWRVKIESVLLDERFKEVK